MNCVTLLEAHSLLYSASTEDANWKRVGGRRPAERREIQTLRRAAPTCRPALISAQSQSLIMNCDN